MADDWNPRIITRAEAGLDDPLFDRLTPRPTSALDGLVFHHAGVSYGGLGVGPEAVWRAIQRYHMGPHGSEAPHSDIDYNAGIWPEDGTILLGRASDVRGAHDAAFNYNWTHTGVVLLGDGRTDDMTDAAWQSFLFLWKVQAYVVGRPQAIVTHGETLATACPGDRLQGLVDDLRRFLSAQAG